MDEANPKIHFKVKSEKRTAERGKENGMIFAASQILLVLVSFFLIYNIVKSVDLTIRKVNIMKQAEREMDDLRLKNIDLILTQEQVETDDFVETEARDRLNLAKEKEQVFVISEMAMEYGELKVNEILNDGDDEVQKPVVEQWSEFLFNMPLL